MNTSKTGQLTSTPEMFFLVEEELRAVERELALESVASVEAVTRIASSLQNSGGKRLRPSLLLLCAQLAADGEPLGQPAIRLAAVVEMIHSATLVHDDIIDMASTRRGRPSTNAQWGNHTSVLAGDWLYMQAFQIALRMRNFPHIGPADRPDTTHGGRRTDSTGAHRQGGSDRGRLHGTGGPQDSRIV